MLRKRILIILGVVAFSAAAFAGGVLVQREYQAAQMRAAQDFARDLAGLKDPVPPAPPWDEWQYPNAKSQGSILGSSLRLSGELVRPAGRYAVLVTTDDFESVARFYAKKTNFDDPDTVAKSRSAVSSQGNLQGESNHLLDDFNDANDAQKSRPVRAKCLIRRCPSYDLTVFVTRADDETHTHIVLLYDPKPNLAAKNPE